MANHWLTGRHWAGTHWWRDGHWLRTTGGGAIARAARFVSCPVRTAREEIPEILPAPTPTPGGTLTDVFVASGSFTRPAQDPGETVDDYVPAQIPFQPKFIFWETTNRLGPIDATLYGNPDNTDSGDVFQGISHSNGWSLFGEEGDVHQHAHAYSTPYRRNWGNETHVAHFESAFAWYGHNFFILPGTATANVLSYTEASPGVWDFTIRYNVVHDGVGGASVSFPAGALVRWTAYGGDGITDAKFVHWVSPNSFDTEYTFDVTKEYAFGPDIGFKPDFLWSLFWAAGQGDDFNNGKKFGMSFANCAGEQASSSVQDGTFVVPTNTANWQVSDAMIGVWRPEGQFKYFLEEMLDGGGFRVRVENPDASLVPPEATITTLAVKGLSSKISRVVAPATVVNKSGVVPRALLALSSGYPPNTTGGPVDGSRLSLGVYTADGQHCFAADAPDDQSFTPVGPFFIPNSGNAWSVDYDGALIARLVNDTEEGAPTVQARAHAVDFDEIVWDDDDGSGFETITCVLGTGGGGTCEGAGVIPTGVARVQPCEVVQLCTTPEVP